MKSASRYGCRSADPAFLKSLLERQRTQNEQMTIVSMRSMLAAEKSYQSANGGFGCTLSALGSAGNAGHRYLYDSQLASGRKNGYVFAISGCDASHYQFVAEPAVLGSGQRAFCSDEEWHGARLRRWEGGYLPEQRRSLWRRKLRSLPFIPNSAPPQSNSSSAASSRNIAACGNTGWTMVRISQGVSEGLIVSKVPPNLP